MAAPNIALAFIFRFPNLGHDTDAQLRLAASYRCKELVLPLMRQRAGTVMAETESGLLIGFTDQASALASALDGRMAMAQYNEQQADSDRKISGLMFLTSRAPLHQKSLLTSWWDSLLLFAQRLPNEQLYFDETFERPVSSQNLPHAGLESGGSLRQLGLVQLFVLSDQAISLENTKADDVVDADILEANKPQQRAQFRQEVFDLTHAKERVADSPKILEAQRLIKLSLDDADEKVELDEQLLASRKVSGSATQSHRRREVASATKSKERFRYFLHCLTFFTLIFGLYATWHWVALPYIAKKSAIPRSPIKTEVSHEEARDILDPLGKREKPKPVGGPQSGVVEIWVKPAGQVYLDGRLIGSGSRVLAPKVTLSDHTLEVRSPGYETYTQLFNLDSAKLSMEVELRRP